MSLLPSLYKREEFPLFGKEGLGEIFEEYVFSITDSLVRQKKLIVKVIFRRYNRINEGEDQSRFYLYHIS
jgi:hypothetical protein